MKPREYRLRGILEILAARPEGHADRMWLIGRVTALYQVAPGTVFDDLRDLALREWVFDRFGGIGLTREGRRVLKTEVPGARGQKQLPEAEAGS